MRILDFNIEQDKKLLLSTSSNVLDLTLPIKLYERFLSFMREKNGVGLSAIQVGIPQRFFLVHDLLCINPVILTHDEEIESHEGCLSLPGVTFKVRRANLITVNFIDMNGDLRLIQLKGLPAVIFQHELDHLNGVLINKC